MKCNRILVTVSLWRLCFLTFNNISVISWRSVLLMEKTSNTPQVTDKTLSHNVASSTPHHEWDYNSQLLQWKTLIAQVVVYRTTIRSRARRSLNCVFNKEILDLSYSSEWTPEYRNQVLYHSSDLKLCFEHLI